MGRSTVYNRIVTKEKYDLVDNCNIDLLEDFMEYLKSTGKSPHTIKQYKNDLKIFFVWNLESNSNKPFYKLTKRDYVKFNNQMLNIWNWSPKRIRRVKSTISSMSNYICDILDEEEEYEDFKPLINNIKSPKNEAVRDKTIYSEDEVEKLLNDLVEMKSYEKACAIAIVAYSGMRKAELLQMKASFFDEKHLQFDGALYVTDKIRAKGSGENGHQMEKYILSKVKPYLDYWLDERESLGVDVDDLFVWCDESNVWRRRRKLDNWYEEFTELTGKDFYLHSLRHFTCTKLLSENIPSEVVKEFFKWGSVDMVSLYNDTDLTDTFGKYFTKDGIVKQESKSFSDL